MLESMFDKLQCPKTMLSAVRTELSRYAPEYESEKTAFESAVCRLREEIGAETCVDLDAALAEEDRTMGERLVFLFWRGIQQNLRCYQDPVEKQFLKLDYEEIHQEAVMNQFILAESTGITGRLLDAFPESVDEAVQQIISYYAYLETVAYKLVHFQGFRFGDRFLTKVVPGYVPDEAVTKLYEQMLSEYISFR